MPKTGPNQTDLPLRAFPKEKIALTGHPSSIAISFS